MNAITLENVSYSYPTSKAGINNISMQVKAGEIACLVGASGCGKSTLFKLIAGFLKPIQGRIILDDVVVADANKNIFIRPHKRHVGLVFQEHALFPHLNILDNMRFGEKKNQPSIAMSLLETLRLTDKAKNFPHE